MLVEFLKSLIPIIEEEKRDFNDVVSVLLPEKK